MNHCTLCSKLGFLFLLCTSILLPVRHWFVQLIGKQHLVCSGVQRFSHLCTSNISNQMMMGPQSRSGSHCPLLECLCCQHSVWPLVCLLFSLEQRHYFFVLYINIKNYAHNFENLKLKSSINSKYNPIAFIQTEIINHTFVLYIAGQCYTSLCWYDLPVCSQCNPVSL